jgi:hypothetical protein
MLVHKNDDGDMFGSKYLFKFTYTNNHPHDPERMVEYFPFFYSQSFKYFSIN